MFQLVYSVFYSKLLWLSVVFLLVYLYLKKVVYNYWENHGVPQEDTTVPTGIFGTEFLMRKITLGNLLKNSYEKFKKYPYHGIYMLHSRYLMINDPELIKQILVKDFANFCDRGLYCNKELDPLSANLFFLPGDTWRILRAKLSPTFTSGKLKYMFPILKNIADNMIKAVDEKLLKTDIIELKDIIARYTTDTIFNLAFGVDSNCLKEENNEFGYHGNLAFKFSAIRLALGVFAPHLLEIFRQPVNNPKVTKFFIKIFQDMVEKRKLEKVNRNDFLDSLIHLMEHEQTIKIGTENITEKVGMLEAAAQAFAFFAAGFETSSSVATHCLYELALNPEVQEKLHEEIDELTSKSKDLTYDNIPKLEYLDMTFHEAMRKHPSVPILNRVSLEDYKMPDSNLTVPKGTGIVISVSGLQSDPDIYPEPEKFDPTRFSKENTASRHPFTFLAFGEGPRICIGKRLGVLQSKMALFYMLKHYKFSVCTQTQIPHKYAVENFVQTPGTGVYLKTERRKVY